MYLVVVLLSMELLFGVLMAKPSQISGRVLGDSDNAIAEQIQEAPADGVSSQNQQIAAEPSVQPESQQQIPPTDTPTEVSPQVSPTDVSSQNVVSPNNSSIVQVETNTSDTTQEQSKNGQNAFQADMDTKLTSLDAVVFPDATVQGPGDQLSEQTIDEVNQQEQQLNTAASPEEQTDLLIHFETNAVQAADTNVKSNNFDDVGFIAQRLSYQIDKSLDIIQQLPKAESVDFKNKIEAVCKDTEYVFRPEELVVPEDVEQSLQESRGKCFNIIK